MLFTEYHTRLAAYAVLVNGADEILLTWFNGGPHGTEPAWSLPGGGVEFDERITDGLVREVLEETGYDVRVGELLAEHHFTGMSSHRADLPFRSQRFLYAAEIVGGRLGTLEEGGTTDFARWVPQSAFPLAERTADVVDLALTLACSDPAGEGG